MALAMFQWGFFYRDGRDRFNGLLNEKLRYASRRRRSLIWPTVVRCACR